MWLGRVECIGEVVTLSQPVYSEPQPHGRHREIAAILLMAISLLILLSLHTNATGTVGLQLSNWLRRIFGLGAEVPAVFLFAAGVAILRQRVRQGRGRRITALLIMYAAALTGYHLIVTEIEGPLSPYWVQRVGEEMRGGGYVGASLGSALLVAFGPWGSAVVLVAAFLVGITLYLETPVSHVVSAIVGAIARAFRAGAGGLYEFGAGLVREVKELVAMIHDQQRRVRVQRAARAVERAAARASEPASPSSRELQASSSWSQRTDAESVAGAASAGGPAASFWGNLFSGRGRRRSPSEDAHLDKEREPQALEAASLDPRAESAAVLQEPAEESRFTRPRREGALPAAGRNGEGSDPSTKGAGAAGGNSAASHAKSRRSEPAAMATNPERTEAPPAYVLPDPALLERPRESRNKRTQETHDQGRLLEETLATFGVQAKVVHVSRGPVVTRYELQPAPGVKVSKIVNLADDVALNLAAADVRIEAPVPGKSVVGIEVPNKEPSIVYFREVIESAEFQKAGSKLAIGLGKDVAGNPVIADLTKLLHVLIAGATGSGKSVCINTLICSLLYRAQPHEVKLMMIDPKRVELAVYDGIPHLITPVVTDPKLASNALRWAVKEMEARYKKFSEARVRNIDGYNRGVEAGAIEDEAMPYLVVIIDELADLMLVAQNEVEDNICRLAQMARAAGIHLVIATQRPSVDVITGLIKANVPSRIAFAVSSGVDSRTILDMVGAERLLGKGDMLYYPIGANKPIRAQGAWISDKEVQAIVNFWKQQGEPVYAENVTDVARGGGVTDEGDDELFEDAVRLVVETGNASISMLQRRFRIGYARAARLIDMMELQGIVGPYQGSKPREVLRTIDDLDELFNNTN